MQIFFQSDSEPEIKTDIFGDVYVTGIQGVPGGVDLWKSITKGTSFVYMGQPDGAQDHCQTIMQCAGIGGGDDSIDVSNGGYLYVSSLWAGNVTMSSSYDGGTGGAATGQAWQVHPAAAGLPSDDRQWIAAYGPQNLYLTYNVTSFTNPPGTEFGLFFVKSTDGGKTFSAPAAVTPLGQTDTVNLEGNLVVDQYNGNIYTAYIPNGSDNVIKIARSTDGGTTWTTTTAYTGPVGTTNRGVFPILAVDRGGNLHLAFTKSDASGHTNCHIFLTSAANPAAASPTWTTAVQVDNGAANVSAAMPWIVAGSPGIVDVTWLGSTTTSPDTANSNWHVFFAQVTNALSGSPTIAQNQVESAIMHNHSLCFDGGGCTSNGSPHAEPGNRDLAEYYTMTIDADGNANIAYADSLNNCNQDVTVAPFCQNNSWFTKQTAGPSAYSPPTAPTPASFAANIALPLSSGTDSPAEPNMKADSHNCLFSASPGAPDAWKSTNAGTSFSLLPNPVVSPGAPAGGGDEDIFPFPQPSGARPDQLYFADLAVLTVYISKSTDGGATWIAPGPGGAAGQVSGSVDRQWLTGDRDSSTPPNQTVYLWEHEFFTQVLRMSALTNDMAWSPPASGMADPELIAPPGSTLSNTVPGPTFVDPATHVVYGFLSASTVTTNVVGAPTGKLPNVWEADGAGTFTAGVMPGPFTNHPVFKGVIDSPTNPAPPAGSATVGSNTANLFNGATIDSAGNIYATWATPNARNGLYDVWFASSHDHGHTFYGPFKINQSGIQGNMPWIAAGDNGRVDIVYYGTSGTEDPTTSTTDQWNVFFAQSLNAADREPVFTVVTASDHVNHIGQICNVGILCGPSPINQTTRNLLDFFQVAIGPDGLANIAYTDTGSQPAGAQSRHISYARQNGGPLALTNPSAVTCLPPPPPPSDVVSRKTHETSPTPTDFDIHLLPPNPAIEMRRNTGADTTGSNVGRDHRIVFTFPVSVTVSGAPNCTASGGATCTLVGTSGSIITADLHSVTDVQALTITLTNVTGGGGSGPVSVLMKVLAGDTNEDSRTNVGDINQTKSRSGQLTDDINFRNDVNLDGRINVGDINFVKAHSGHFLP